MTSSITGLQQTIPASKAFEPGQAPNNPNNTPQTRQGPQPVAQSPSFVQPGKTEEINQKLSLSRDLSRIDPSQVTNDSQQRGQVLDLSV